MSLKRIIHFITALVLCITTVLAPITATAGTLSPQESGLQDRTRQDGQPLIEMPDSKGTITVGSKDFTEQLLLGQFMVLALEEMGYTVIDRTGLVGGNSLAHNALVAGEVDIIWDYIGTILSEAHGVPPSGLPSDLESAYQMGAALDARHHNLTWLDPTPFNNTYTMMIEPTTIAAKTGEVLSSIDDLADYMNRNEAPLTVCVENEFYARNDGLFSMQAHYGFEFKEENVQVMAYDQLYEGLREGLCDVAEGYSTDGRISAWNLQNLDDSSLFFPVYNTSPIVRNEILEQYPDIAATLNSISALLHDTTMADLNAQIDIGPDGSQGTGDEANIREVAYNFLQEAGIIAKEVVPGPTVIVGSRDFTEQLILGQIIVVMLEDAGYTVTDLTGLGGTNSAHDALKAGEVDIIWDYIGTILSESHGIPPIGLPADTNIALEMVRGLDAHHHDLIWLTPTAFNDTYTMMVRPEAIEEKAGEPIASMDELADYMNENDSPLTVCVENEFYSRGDGLFSMQEHYGFEFKEENIEIVAYDQLYEGLREGLCDVAEGFSTDGRISSWGFQNLADSDLFFPAYNASPIVRRQLLADFPEIGELLDRLGPALDNETIALLNARVDIGPDGERGSGDEEAIKDVAFDFLRRNRLLRAPEISVGSRDFTEQLLLGQILIGALESAGFKPIDKTGLGGTNSAHDAIKSGEVDIIWEYIGTILSESHGVPPIGLPTDTDTALKMVQGLDAHHHDLIWLEPTPFNDTYTMMVRPEAIEEKAGEPIASMDDLADYMNANDSPLTVCVENEFYSRGDGLFSMQEHYGFEFKEENIEIVAYDQLYEGLKDDLCDVAEGFSTDGRISAWAFQNLDDSRQFFPAYNASPIIRAEVLENYPELADVLNDLSKHLDNETVAQLNARIDIGADGERSSGDEEAVQDVALSFLASINGETAGEAAGEAASDESSVDGSSADGSSADDESQDGASANDATESSTSTDTGNATESADDADSTPEADDQDASDQDAGDQDAGDQTVTDEQKKTDEISETSDVAGSDASPDDASLDSDAAGESDALTGADEETSSGSDSAPDEATEPQDEPADAGDNPIEDESGSSPRLSDQGNQLDVPAFVPTNALLDRNLVVASTDMPAQRLLGEMVTAMLQDVGITVINKIGLGDSEALRTALANQEIDLYTDLSSDALVNYHQLSANTLPTETAEVMALVNSLDKDEGLVWFTPIEFNGNYAVLIKEALAKSAQISNLDELAAHMKANDDALSLCSPRRLFEDEQLGMVDLFTSYEITFNPRNILIMDQEETYSALRNDQCDMAIGLRSEGRIGAWNLVIVDDSEIFFPSFPSAAITRQEILETEPGLSEYIATLSPILSDTVIQGLTAQIELGPDGEPSTGDEATRKAVVRTFLCEQRILTDCTDSEIDTSLNNTPATDTPTPQPIRIEVQSSPIITVPVDFSVNARITTDTEAQVIEVLERGQVYPVIARTEDNAWLKIRLEDQDAWVFTEAVFYSPGVIENLPIVSP